MHFVMLLYIRSLTRISLYSGRPKSSTDLDCIGESNDSFVIFRFFMCSNSKPKCAIVVVGLFLILLVPTMFLLYLSNVLTLLRVIRLE